MQDSFSRIRRTAYRTRHPNTKKSAHTGHFSYIYAYSSEFCFTRHIYLCTMCTRCIRPSVFHVPIIAPTPLLFARDVSLIFTYALLSPRVDSHCRYISFASAHYYPCARKKVTSFAGAFFHAGITMHNAKVCTPKYGSDTGLFSPYV